MNAYKPEHLGKVIPANDQSKLTDFVTNKFDAFSSIFNTVKDCSDKITDLKTVETGGDSSSLSIKITTDRHTVELISEKIKDSESVKMSGDVITAGGQVSTEQTTTTK